MGADSQLAAAAGSLGAVLATMLEERFPLQTQKQVAHALSCTPKAAENLLNGHLSARNLTWVIEHLGPGFVAEAVMRAAGHTLESFIDHQAAEAERTAAQALERAEEARRLHATLSAARRSDPVDSRPGAER